MVSLFWNCFSHKTEIHLFCVKEFGIICTIKSSALECWLIHSIYPQLTSWSANTRWTLNQQIDQHLVDSQPTHRHQSAQDGTSAKINQLLTDCQSRVPIDIQLQMPFEHDSEFVRCKLETEQQEHSIGLRFMMQFPRLWSVLRHLQWTYLDAQVLLQHFQLNVFQEDLAIHATGENIQWLNTDLNFSALYY